MAFRSDPADPNAGQLVLDGVDVSSQTSFTADQFSRLTFVAGATGSSQDLVVVAQTGTLAANGTLNNVTDSPAVQITASVTGTRSINAVGALRTVPTGSDASFVNTASAASIFTGVGQAGPTLKAVGTPLGPNLDPGDLATLLGAYQSSQAIPPAQSGAAPSTIPTFDALQLYPGGIGGSEASSLTSAQEASQSIASWLLSNAQVGGLQTGGSKMALQDFGIAAYEKGQQST